jgi:hypothetical protein
MMRKRRGRRRKRRQCEEGGDFKKEHKPIHKLYMFHTVLNMNSIHEHSENPLFYET